MSTASHSRRLLVAIGMVGAPICLAAGNLILPALSGSPVAQAHAIAANSARYLTGSIIDAAGFALLGALGVGVAMLLPRRGSTIATIGAVLTIIGGVVMSGAVLTTAFVQSAIAVSQASVLTALQSNAPLGVLFQFALVAAVGGLLGAIGLLIGRPVSVWVSILLIVGVLLSAAGGGVLGAVLTIPFLVADALIAGALVRSPHAIAAAAAAPHEAVPA